MKLHVFYIKSAIWVPLPQQLMRQPKMLYLTLRKGDCSSSCKEDGLMSLLVLNMKLHIKHSDRFMEPYMEARKRMLFHIVLKKSQNQNKKVNNTLVC